MVMTDEHKAAIKAGRERAKAERNAANKIAEGFTEALSVAEGKTAVVIYRPFDGEPHTTIWNGISFKANVPVMLDRANPKHSYEQLLPIKMDGPRGTETKHVPAQVFMGDIARGNPAFEVDGVRVPKMVNKRVLPAAGHGWAEDHEDEISVSRETEEVA